jgi:phage-related holin
MEKYTTDTTIISASIIAVFTYLGIDAEIFLAYTALLFIDFFLGSLKAFSKGKFTSRRAINGFAGKVVLLLVILSV